MKLFKQALKYGRKVSAPVVVSGGSLLVSTGAFAVGTDFSSISSGVDASTVVTAIVAMGAIMILPNVAKWAAKKIATFF